MAAEVFAQDVRIGLRVLAKERSFSALSIFVLALGICAVTTMFTTVDATLLRGFSFPNSERLTDVQFIDPSTVNAFGANNQVFAMDYEEFKGEQRSFEKMAAYLSGSTVNLTADGEPRRYTGAYVTEDFLAILGVRPALGRDFTAEDNRPGAAKVLILAYGVWQRDFGGAPNIVGKDVRLNGKPATVIGVMPEKFSFPNREEMWIPLYSEFPVRPRNDPLANSPAVIGLIRTDVSVEQAQAEFAGFARRFAAAYPDTNKAFSDARVQPLIKTFTPRPVQGMLLTMFAFGVGVLLIGCMNVMNMQFARATGRLKELAVRASLGATRARLVRQMLTESLLVASLGALLGVGLSFFTVGWMDAALKSQNNGPPQWMVFEVNSSALAMSILATLAAALASGLLPALMSSRTNTVTALNDTGKGNSSRGVHFLTRGLVVFQIATTCVLLIGSILQARSIVKQQTIDYGYDTGGIMSARMGLMEGDYPTPVERKAFFDRLLLSLQASPQFESVALTNRFQMVFSGSGPIEIEGKKYAARNDRPNANFEQVTPGYFGVLGQRILEGRGIQDDDLDSKQPVAVVNEGFARRHFGSESAIGRRFRTGNGEQEAQMGPWRTIVGVVSNVRMLGPFNNRNTDETGFYVPFYSVPFGPMSEGPLASQFATVIVRPRPGQSADAILPALRAEVRKVDPNLPLYFAATPKANLEAAVYINRIVATMFTSLGFVAIALASIGVYGVMAFSVSQRTLEFGVRMALGAGASKILQMVVRQGAREVALGLFLGLATALGIAAIGREGIASMLFGVSAFDPPTYVLVFALVTVVSLFAVWVPARRATRVRPMVALRAQ
jgi:predicted permease